MLFFNLDLSESHVATPKTYSNQNYIFDLLSNYWQWSKAIELYATLYVIYEINHHWLNVASNNSIIITKYIKSEYWKGLCVI